MVIKNNDRLFLPGNHAVIESKQNKFEELKESQTVVIFHHPGCHACRDAINYIEKTLKRKYPNIAYKYYDITSQKGMEVAQSYYEIYGMDSDELTTPTIFIGENHLVGYDKEGNSGDYLEIAIKKNYLGEELTEEEQKVFSKETTPNHVNTLFGQVNIFEKSLPVLAVTLGLLDGFNPCSMWVLVYLITLIAGLRDRSKIWLIVGSFVMASGVLYFLFMTALLNVFLYIGYLRILELFFGCIALYAGGMSMKTYLIDRGQAVCKVSGDGTKEKIKSKIRKLVSEKFSVIAVLGVIALAFVVNSMEFVCSAALPAVFTSILAQADISIVVYYLYILLYVFFFLLNHLVIFGAAAIAIERFEPDKYMFHIQLLGGTILLALGIIMVFFPEYLR